MRLSGKLRLADLAARHEVAQSDVLEFERMGLLLPAQDADGRYYSHVDELHLQIIRKGMRLGFDCREISLLLADAEKASGAPRRTFFFHLRTPEELKRDEVGLALDSVEAALDEARRILPGLAEELRAMGRRAAGFAVHVTDGAGRLVAEIAVAEAAEPPVSAPWPDGMHACQLAHQHVSRMRHLLDEVRSERSLLAANVAQLRALVAG